MSPGNQRQQWSFTLTDASSISAVDYLAQQTGLSKRRLKEVMLKGAVWLRHGHGKQKRLRRASAQLRRGDSLQLYYDPDVLDREAPCADRLWFCAEYSVWYKPAGMLAQGNEYGDHCALLRQAELADPLRKPVYLVHRLDREAQGLMLLAHSQTAARHLSQLFQQNKVDKNYRVIVRGRPVAETGRITQALDGKPAHTDYRLIAYDAQSGQSELYVTLHTGRTHQIRRHLDMLGHPVMGDPRYGRDNKTDKGLQLYAIRLRFMCPFTQREQDFELDALLRDKPAHAASRRE